MVSICILGDALLDPLHHGDCATNTNQETGPRISQKAWFLWGLEWVACKPSQFIQTLKLTHLLVAWDMTICCVHVCAHSIHWRLPRKIIVCNIVIKKRRHCMGLGAQLPSDRGWLPSLQEYRRLRISASSYFRIYLRLKGRLYWLVTFDAIIDISFKLFLHFFQVKRSAVLTGHF